MKHTAVGSVVLAGGINLDIQGISNSAFRNGDSNPGRIIRSPGGVCRNIAENLLRLEVPVRLISAFGKDPEGANLKQDCLKKGIDISLSLTTTGNTARYLCLASFDASLIGAVADMEIMQALTPDYFESIKAALTEAAVIVVDTNIPKASIEWFARQFGRTGRARRAGQKGPMLVLDTVSATKSLKAREVLAEFDLAKPNLEEARVLAGLNGAAETESLYILEALHTHGTLPAELFISLGERGILYANSDLSETGLVSLPPPNLRPEARNRSGAGDAACAGLVYASLQGLPMQEKARYALTMAVIAAAALQTVHPEMDVSMLKREKERLYESIS